MSHKIVKTDKAPAAVGPYSQGVVAGGLLFTAMQIALDPESGEMKGDSAPRPGAVLPRKHQSYS